MKESMAAPIGVAKIKVSTNGKFTCKVVLTFIFGSAVKARSISANRLRQGYTKSFCGAFYKKRQKVPAPKATKKPKAKKATN